MKLSSAAKKLQEGIEETLTCMDFPTQYWTRIRINHTIERLNREMKRRTKAIGAFPDGQSALMLVCARLRHVAGTQWRTRRYKNMDHLSKSVHRVETTEGKRNIIRQLLEEYDIETEEN